MHVVDDPQGGARVRRVLHVHPHEAPAGSGVLHDLLKVRPAKLLVQRQAESGGLDGDAALQAVLVQSVYDLLVVAKLRGGIGLTLGALAEQVYGGDASLLVQVADRLHGLLQRIARDVAAGDLLHYRPRYHGYRLRYGLVYNPHGLSPPTRGAVLPMILLQAPHYSCRRPDMRDREISSAPHVKLFSSRPCLEEKRHPRSAAVRRRSDAVSRSRPRPPHRR